MWLFATGVGQFPITPFHRHDTHKYSKLRYMRRSASICIGLVGLAVIMVCVPTFSQLQPLPHLQANEFVVGRHSFIDIGPPLDFYEVFIVRPDSHGSAVERLTITPHGDACFVPAKVETASASINQPSKGLLGSKNPCRIPEKALQQERKRRKEGLVFSGADVVWDLTGSHIECV